MPTPGTTVRHGRRCRSREGGRCNCSPSYEACVFSKTEGKKIRRTFSDLAKAKGWRSDARDRYKPSAIRSYDRALKLRVLPALGHVRLTELRRVDVHSPRS